MSKAKHTNEVVRQIMRKHLSDFKLESDLGIAIQDAIEESVSKSIEMYEVLKEIVDNSKHFTDDTGISEDFYQLINKANNLIKKIEG